MNLELHGHPIHTRSLGIQLRVADERVLEARGEILDLRKLGVLPMTSDLQTAGFIHHMRLRLRAERATRRIQAIELEQPAVAFEASAATGGESCRDPSPRLQTLVGDALDAGFPKRLSELVGGPRGCSHVLTLFQALASALPPALDREEEQVRAAGARGWTRRAGELVYKRSLAIDGMRQDAQQLGLALQLHDFHTLPFDRDPGPMQRLELQRELRIQSRVDVATIRFLELRAAERERSGADLGAGRWEALDAEVAPLVGRSVASGLARELIARFGSRPERRGLLDALLNLGPAVVQCTPALVDFMIGAGGAAPSGEASGAGAAKPAPAVAPAGARELSGAILMGGFPDSCFMWRRDGILARGRRSLDERLKRDKP